MKKHFSGLSLLVAGSLLATIAFTGCDVDNDDPALPPIGGYNNSDEVAAANLKANWTLDGSGNERISGATPTSIAGVSFTGGVRGQAATFNNGYIYYNSAVGGALASNQPFSVSAWIKAANNGLAGGSPPANNHPLQYFQLARPGQLFGSINLLYEAGSFPIASDTMNLKSLYYDGGGFQDAVLCCGTAGVDYKVVKKAGTGSWVHLVTTYNPTGGTGNESIFRIYADSVQVNNTLYENRGAASYVYVPHQVIIGGWYNNIPGMAVSADPWTTPFTGMIDDVRLFNKALTPAEISALYKLGLAGR
jgi:hypothetical protein